MSRKKHNESDILENRENRARESEKETHTEIVCVCVAYVGGWSLRPVHLCAGKDSRCVWWLAMPGMECAPE